MTIATIASSDPGVNQGTASIASIIVGERHRRDMGDIDGLAASIAELGLLHPVVITPDGRLIAGERRLVACKQLGWATVPVTVIQLDELLNGELAENTARKDFTPMEATARDGFGSKTCPDCNVDFATPGGNGSPRRSARCSSGGAAPSTPCARSSAGCTPSRR